MLFSSILILIVAKALPLFSNRIASIHFTRISAIILLLSGILSFNIYYIQSIGSGIGIYSGLFIITNISQTIEFFLLIIGLLILFGWPNSRFDNYNNYRSDKMENLLIQFLNILTKFVTKLDNELLRNFWNCGIKHYNEFLQNKPKLVNIANSWTNQDHVVKTACVEKETSEYAVDYSIIILFSTLGSSLLVSSFDLISIYLSIELQSFGLYILTTLYRNSRNHGINASNAGLKYFLLGGLSSAIILLGSGIIYSYTGLTQLESIFTFITTLSNRGYSTMLIGIILGLIFIIIGLLFKIAAAPLHNWSPDVYDESPTIVTTWLTIMPKISILVLLLELNLLTGFDYSQSVLHFNNIFGEDLLDAMILGFIPKVPESMYTYFVYNKLLSCYSIGKYYLTYILLISSFASLIIGTIVGLAQIKIKRLLAYSTISHIGFMLLALAINTEQSIDSFLFYIIQYIITNLNIFLIILAISYSKEITGKKSMTTITMEEAKTISNNTQIRDIKYIKELSGLFFKNPILSLTLSISLFSMAGIPPLIGFFSKQFVLNSALEQEYYFMSIIAIIVSVISASYYLKIIKLLHLQANDESVSDSQKTKTIEQGVADSISIYIRPVGYLSNSHSYLISSLSLFILLFILKPNLILSSTQVLSLTLFNN